MKGAIMKEGKETKEWNWFFYARTRYYINSRKYLLNKIKIGSG